MAADPRSASGDASAPTDERRDRDQQGRARNARPRDELGRPLPRGEAGTARLTEGQVRTPSETIELAQRLLAEGRPFHAHEVFEDAWKSAPEQFRLIWKGLAQLAVGVTHCARGNAVGAVTLLRRAAATLADFRASTPYGLRIAEVADWSAALADRIELTGIPAPPIELPPLQ